VRDLLERGERLALLVRGSKKESAEERVEAILGYWEEISGRRLQRPVLLHGDIRQPLLGLGKSEVDWVAKNCHSMMHSAASLKFLEDGTGEPRLTNIEGTRNMLSLCKAANVRQLHYVSTAYVCGLRDGTIYEHELDCEQEFRNDYEKSKLEAETLVRNAGCFDRLTVYRPAVISGDSKTGYTNTYHGIYLYLRLMAMLVPRQPLGPDGLRLTRLRLPMTGNERRNVVPIDWVSRVMTELYLNSEAHGQTFHLAPEECLTPKQIIDAGYSYFHSTGIEYVGYQYIDPATYNAFEMEMLPGLSMYSNYESTDPIFDCSNVKRFASHVPCPRIDEAMLHTYIRYGEEDRWGKRKTPARIKDNHGAEEISPYSYRELSKNADCNVVS
jgi:nucleoside-diphosphate-sugar epimerase